MHQTYLAVYPDIASAHEAWMGEKRCMREEMNGLHNQKGFLVQGTHLHLQACTQDPGISGHRDQVLHEGFPAEAA
jgi:hypothetical protein